MQSVMPASRQKHIAVLGHPELLPCIGLASFVSAKLVHEHVHIHHLGVQVHDRRLVHHVALYGSTREQSDIVQGLLLVDVKWRHTLRHEGSPIEGLVFQYLSRR